MSCRYQHFTYFRICPDKNVIAIQKHRRIGEVITNPRDQVRILMGLSLSKCLLATCHKRICDRHQSGLIENNVQILICAA